MSKTKKVGDSPINARIKIKYNGKYKPKISFSYPQKHSQMRGSYLVWIRLFILMFFVTLLLGYELGSIFFGYSLFYGDDDLSRTYEKTSLQEFSECVAMNPIKTLTNFTGVYFDDCKRENARILINYGLVQLMITFLLLCYIIPIIIYYPFRKKWDKLYPKTEAFFASKKFKVFRKKDIIEKDGRIYIELPVFSNVVLNFKASNDFSKYLDEVEIKEYEFSYFRRKKIRWGKKKKNFYQKNEWIWYARWYFISKPQKGEIKVIFK